MDNVFNIFDHKPSSRAPVPAESDGVHPIPGFSVDPTNTHYQRDIERGYRPFENYPTYDQATAELQDFKELLIHKYPPCEEYVKTEFDKILADPNLSAEKGLEQMREVLSRVDAAEGRIDDTPIGPGVVKLGNHAILHAEPSESAPLAPVVSLFDQESRNQ